MFTEKTETMIRKPYKLGATTGTIKREKIVSRIEIDQVLKLLENQSVRVEEIRRMGKTMLVQKLEYRTQNEELGNKAVYFILQGVKGLDELTDNLLEQLLKYSSKPWLKTKFKSLKDFYKRVKPSEIDIKGMKFSTHEFAGRWKESLGAILKDIAERSNEKDEVFTLILDELPLMLWDWIKAGKAHDAMQLLDELRKLRYQFKEEGKIRYLICGSVGMNVVLSKLRDDHGYTGEPFNDFEIFSLGNMTRKDARFLCECLFLSGFEADVDKEKCMDLILEYSSRLPYFIHKIFSYLNLNCSSKLSRDNIELAIKDILENHQNSACEVFDQLTNRLSIYYPIREEKAMKILEMICQKDSVDEKELLNSTDIEKKELLETLEVLQKEQYLTRNIINERRHYSFKYKIIKRWWRINKV